MTYFHGGYAGLSVGDMLVPSAPHITDGCPICVARAQGRPLNVGEYRAWIKRFGALAEPVLRQLADAPDDVIIDAPSNQQVLYITTDREYARFYAARSKGDLYQVEPIGQPESTTEDHFPSYTVQLARVIKVLERGVMLTRKDRRHLTHKWEKADKAASVR